VFLTIHGQRHYLWRAVDQDEHGLDILVQSRRNPKAAKKFFRKWLKGLQYVPRVVITAKWQSYGAASVRDCLGWNTARVAISRTGVSMRIGRRANGNVACRGAPPPVMPSVCCLRMDPSPNTAARDGICCQRPRTVKR
jgi:hypothetical protein